MKRVLKVLVDKNRGIDFALGSSSVNNNNNNNNNDEKKENALPSHVDLTTSNLNKLDDSDLQKVKDVMDEEFEKNRLKPGDEGWKYDVEVDFSTPQGGIESSAWDNDDDDSDMEF